MVIRRRNAFQRRQLELQARRDRQARDEHERMIQLEATMRRVEEVFLQVTNVQLSLSYKDGWVRDASNPKGYRWRPIALSGELLRLEAMLHERELDTPPEPV